MLQLPIFINSTIICIILGNATDTVAILLTHTIVELKRLATITEISAQPCF